MNSFHLIFCLVIYFLSIQQNAHGMPLASAVHQSLDKRSILGWISDKKRNWDLFKAVEQGNIQVVESLLEQGASVNAVNQRGSTLLHSAVFKGQAEMVNLLIQRGAYADTANRYGASPLHAAAYHGSSVITNLLIDGGANVNVLGRLEVTPLHVAVYDGHIGIVRLLIDKGANVNAANRLGSIPLHFAAHHGNVNIARLLLEKDTNVNAASQSGRTPLYAAVEKGYVEMASLLIERGADVNAANHDGLSPLDVADQLGDTEMLRIMDNAIFRCTDGWLPIHYAAASGHVDALKRFVARGESVTATDDHGKTPLDYAYENVQIDAIDYLVAQINPKEATLTQRIQNWIGEPNQESMDEDNEWTQERLRDVGMRILSSGDEEKIKRLRAHPEKYHIGLDKKNEPENPLLEKLLQ